MRSLKRGVNCSLWLPQSKVIACGNLECMPSSDDYRGGGGGPQSARKKKYNYPECPGSRDIESKCNKNSLGVHRSQSCWPRSQLVGYYIIESVLNSKPDPDIPQQTTLARHFTLYPIYILSPPTITITFTTTCTLSHSSSLRHFRRVRIGL
jgi:hypothetical protein